MNRTEAKAYALKELGLGRDQVRQFGNLSRTQTWLDAIAAQASEGSTATAANDPSDPPTEPDPVPVPLTDLSFEAFWESPDVSLNPQPLTSISALDQDWEDILTPTSAPEPVAFYPIVIALLMLWAMVQLLLLLGHWIGLGLTVLADTLDAVASRRLAVVGPPPSRPSKQPDQTTWMLARS